MQAGTTVRVVTPSGARGVLAIVGTFPGEAHAACVEIVRLEPAGAADHRVWIDGLGRVVRLEDHLTPIDLELLAAGVHDLLEAPTPEEITA